jgi:hypothetical protein
MIAPGRRRSLVNPLKSRAFHAAGHNLYPTFFKVCRVETGVVPQCKNRFYIPLNPGKKFAIGFPGSNLPVVISEILAKSFIPYLYPKGKISTFFIPSGATSSNIKSLKCPYFTRYSDDRQQSATSSNKYSGGFNSRRLHHLTLHQAS